MVLEVFQLFEASKRMMYKLRGNQLAVTMGGLLVVMALFAGGCDGKKKAKSLVQAPPSAWGPVATDTATDVTVEEQLIEEPLTEPKFNASVQPAVFEQAFRADNEWGLSTQVLGKLISVSGDLLVGDPADIGKLQPYTTQFPKGRFPVELAMARISKYPAVHFLRIRFSDEAVAQWKFALLPDQKDVSIHDSDLYCFKAQTAMAVVMDASARTTFEQSQPEKLWDHVFVDLTEKNGHTGFIYSLKNENLATCSTGGGVGCYAVYLGYDGSGNVCRLLIDFGLIPWWVDGLSPNPS